MKPINRTLLVAALLAVLVLAPGFSAGVLAEDPISPLLGYAEGVGTHFEVTDSEYLNVTLDSSESIDLILLSAPQVVHMLFNEDPAGASTEITLSGLDAGTTYYRYQDDVLEPVAFTTDAAGRHGFDLDLTEPHAVWIQPGMSTYMVNESGGQCIDIGTWDEASLTCTLNQDVFDTIWIMGNGITLDGDGHLISPPLVANSHGIYVPNRSGVTVKNVNVSKAVRGISIFRGSNNTVTGCTVFGGAPPPAPRTVEGIYLAQSHYNTVTGNTVTNGSHAVAIGLVRSEHGNVEYNTVTSEGWGIRLGLAHYCTIAGNRVSVRASTGIGLAAAPAGGGVRNCTVYGNSFLETPTPIAFTGGSGNSFNLAAPDGGNHYTIYDEPVEGCFDENEDGFCDAPFVFLGGQDHLPLAQHAGFVTGGGWVISETGWCQLDELCATAEGTANFGLNAKNKNNDPLPKGQTEFNFSEGGLDFHSAGYEWLVVDPDGVRAQYMGTGTVNGEASPGGELYKFMIWVSDGGSEDDDTFRIRIWYQDGLSEHTVYDTGSEVALGGGSIAVHDK